MNTTPVVGGGRTGGVGLGVAVGNGLDVAVGMDVAVGVAVAVGDGELVGVAVGQTAMEQKADERVAAPTSKVPPTRITSTITTPNAGQILVPVVVTS
ncbi:MAG: hypothetical protein NUW24_06205 [Anaerolineae bacterium]|jgi:hypothetical protein|nr:hypothetical protein [Anaerolineae bacterium]MDH7475401.1 hypothetical protein [Anaerolineae bacterium]